MSEQISITITLQMGDGIPLRLTIEQAKALQARLNAALREDGPKPNVDKYIDNQRAPLQTPSAPYWWCPDFRWSSPPVWCGTDMARVGTSGTSTGE